MFARLTEKRGYHSGAHPGTDAAFGSHTGDTLEQYGRARHGMEFLRLDYEQDGAPDFGDLLGTIRDYQPDLLINGGVVRTNYQIMHAAADAGLLPGTPFMVAFSYPLRSNDFWRLPGTAGVGAMWPAMQYRPSWPGMTEIGRWFTDHYRRRYGDFPPDTALTHFTDVTIVAAASRAARSTDREDMIDAMEAMEFPSIARSGTAAVSEAGAGIRRIGDHLPAGQGHGAVRSRALGERTLMPTPDRTVAGTMVQSLRAHQVDRIFAWPGRATCHCPTGPVDFRLADAGPPHRLPNGRDRWRDGLHTIEEDNVRWVPPDSDRRVALVCDHIGVHPPRRPPGGCRPHWPSVRPAGTRRPTTASPQKQRAHEIVYDLTQHARQENLPVRELAASRPGIAELLPAARQAEIFEPAGGDEVIVLGRPRGGQIRTLAADLSEPDEAARVAREIATLDRPVDVWVNNAGGNQAPTPANDLAGVRRDWQANVVGNVLPRCCLRTRCCRCCAGRTAGW